MFSCDLLQEYWFSSSTVKTEMGELALAGEELSLLESPHEVKRRGAQARESLVMVFMSISFCLWV